MFLDDLRRTPPGWQRARTAWEAITFCTEGNVTDLSLDFDLDAAPRGYGGHHPGDGGQVSAWLLEQAEDGHWENVPPVIRIHSSNEEGVAKMAWHLAEIERLRFAKALGVSPEVMW